MKLTSTSIATGRAVPAEYAFGVPDPESHVAFGANRNPQLAWSEVPQGTQSFALICHDPDVPTEPDDVNQEGREVPSDLLRADFFHWVVAEIPADVRSIAEGSFSAGVTAHGKPETSSPIACRLGINDYTGWFAGDDDMSGDYYGYDGPCPPWNDSIVHHYVFTVFALDTPTLDLENRFGGTELRSAMAGHVLAEASITATYSLNSRVPA